MSGNPSWRRAEAEFPIIFRVINKPPVNNRPTAQIARRPCRRHGESICMSINQCKRVKATLVINQPPVNNKPGARAKEGTSRANSTNCFCTPGE